MAIEPRDKGLTPVELVRLWAHEGLRLFHDRLISEDERAWCQRSIDEVAVSYFHGLDFAARPSSDISDSERSGSSKDNPHAEGSLAAVARSSVLKRPLLYSTWLGNSYLPVEQEELRFYLGERLTVFCEEELDVTLVMFDDVLDHVLRIDNVLRNPMGHLLLVGESGTGKSVLTRFVSWMNSLFIFEIKPSRRYTEANFDDDLRHVMKRAGVDGERICFLFDDADSLSSAFLEKMNALLASGEVPGLFEDRDQMATLMAACRDAASGRRQFYAATSIFAPRGTKRAMSCWGETRAWSTHGRRCGTCVRWLLSC